MPVPLRHININYMWRVRNSNSKYYATSTRYNGRLYHSKFEAQYARDLDLRVKAHDIKGWEPQFKVSLDVNGKHICNYVCDFRLTMNDGSYELHETKGFETDLFRIKRKLLEAVYLKDHPDTEYVLVK
jgi:hypothetical protein